MIKKILTVLTIVALFGLVACQSGTEQRDRDRDRDKDKEVSIPIEDPETTKAPLATDAPEETSAPAATSAPQESLTPEPTPTSTPTPTPTSTPTPKAVVADAAEDFLYTVEGEQVTITGLQLKNAEEIYVPEKLDGYPVTKIADNAFAGQTLVTKLVLPNGLLEVGKEACQGLNIETLIIPASVTMVGEMAYKGCQKLAEVIAEGQELAFGKNVFAECPKLTKASLPVAVFTQDWYISYGFENLKTLFVTEGALEIKDKTFQNIYNLEYIYLPDGLTKIGAYAFNRCGIVGIRLPESLTEIGNNAFEHCTLLEEIRIPKGVHTVGKDLFHFCSSLKNAVVGGAETEIYINYFYYCDRLESVTLPGFAFANHWSNNGKWLKLESLKTVAITEGSTTLKDRSFIDNGLITKVVLPESLEMIGSAAFQGCSSLEEVNLPTGLKEIGNSAFAKCSSLKEATIPTGGTCIRAGAFMNSGLTHIEIPEGIEYIYRKTFEGCKQLVSVQLPATVVEIEEEAFYECSSLTEIVLHENLTKIGNKVFYKCSSLGSVSIPSTLVEIGALAFSYCPAIEKFEVAEGNPVYSTKDKLGNECNAIVRDGTVLVAACKNTLIGEGIITLQMGSYTGNSAITKVVVPENVQTIEAETFANCTNLVSVILPSGLTELKGYMFYGCNALSDITLPAELTTIEDGVFNECYALQVLMIPEKVTYLGSCINDCYSLEKVYINGNIKTAKHFEPQSGGYEVIVGENVTELPEGIVHQNQTNGLIVNGNITYSFRGIQGLEKVIIKGSIPSENYAFSQCEYLEYVELGEGMTSIANGMFSGLGLLTEVHISASITQIADDSFYRCPADMKIYTPAGSYAETWAKEHGYTVVNE